MVKKVLRGIWLAEHKARKRRAQAGEPPMTGDALIHGPSPGSVALDTRAGGRLGIVRAVDAGVVYLREVGSAHKVWDCPVPAVKKPEPADAELAQLLDQGVILEPEDADADAEEPA
ncbi:hypothetical protein ACGF0D_07575 [Kitasatospora sp. NPDC048298]|uniref:hypothetical protein n=1 Tax=Kitasatospora sp. NPDC048298 TaxID=3364049 RepID=UPI003713D6DE